MRTAILALLGMMCVGCAYDPPRLAIRDTSTGKIYYTNEFPSIHDGVATFNDEKTGAAVTIRNSWESVDLPDTNFVLVHSGSGYASYISKRTRTLNVAN